MREKEYRVWCKKRKRMYSVLHLHVEKSYGEGTWATAEGHNIIEQKSVHIQVQPKDAEIMEYIGREDQSGRKIYEGDIVKVLIMGGYSDHYIDAGHIREVKYDEETMRWRPFDVCRVWPDWGTKRLKSVEVIGNIFETPELLKK